MKASLDYRGNVLCVSVSNMGLVELGGGWGVTASSTAQRMLMQEEYIIEAQNRCSVTKISPNSKKYFLSLFRCERTDVEIALKLKFKLRWLFCPIYLMKSWKRRAVITFINKTSYFTR